MCSRSHRRPCDSDRGLRPSSTWVSTAVPDRRTGRSARSRALTKATRSSRTKDIGVRRWTSTWHHDHLEPCLRELRSSRGPFADCTKGDHRSTTACPEWCSASGARDKDADGVPQQTSPATVVPGATEPRHPASIPPPFLQPSQGAWLPGVRSRWS
ncbi:DUF4913 domain-containing protein [Streptomyces sp. NPDC002187]|uniref:DUF4913 domain-containing protein n=1 Tax=Streptomyces sp. NPDC002187 TaxID=3364637 RepID=UPI0036A25868